MNNLRKKLTHLINFNKLQISYSNEGEDLLIDRVLNFKKNGFYVDIGAYHPVIYSNTYKFYLKGWSGVNIDAMPGSMAAFKKIRSRDCNLEIPVFDTSEMLTYYIFNEQALNTLSAEEAQKKDGLSGYKMIGSQKLQTRRLDDILSEYIPAQKDIDFFSVDVEGLDLNVLRSNDWNRFRPTLVLAENLSSQNGIEAALNSDLNQYMSSVGYTFFAKSLNTLFFLATNKL